MPRWRARISRANALDRPFGKGYRKRRGREAPLGRGEPGPRGLQVHCGIASRSGEYYPAPMTTISLKLPESVAERLEAEARARQKPKSALVREFIERGLNDANGKRRPSFHQLAKDKCGRFAGPRDLSTNPKYMEGFGE
jgi:predicted transcriptional regulator